MPPAIAHEPHPPYPHPYPQAIARPTPGTNYPLKSARSKVYVIFFCVDSNGHWGMAKKGVSTKRHPDHSGTLCLFSSRIERYHNQGCENGAFGKRSFRWGDTRHFRHFRRFPGSEEQNPLFLWAECNIRIFANFRQNHLFPKGPCHTKNTTVIVIHYGGSKTLRR